LVVAIALIKDDGLPSQPLRLALRPRLPLPDDLEEVPVPPQQRVGLDEVERVPPAACAPGEHDQEEPVCSPESRALHTSPQDDELLAKKSVLCKEFAAASRGVAAIPAVAVATAPAGRAKRLTAFMAVRAQPTMVFFTAAMTLPNMMVSSPSVVWGAERSVSAP
jgi:hypothetical protein